VRPEGLGQYKKSTSSGLEPATFQLAAQCLNHYATVYIHNVIGCKTKITVRKVVLYFVLLNVRFVISNNEKGHKLTSFYRKNLKK
jgi:hypothetical protein